MLYVLVMLIVTTITIYMPIAIIRRLISMKVVSDARIELMAGYQGQHDDENEKICQSAERKEFSMSLFASTIYCIVVLFGSLWVWYYSTFDSILSIMMILASLASYFIMLFDLGRIRYMYVKPCVNRVTHKSARKLVYKGLCYEKEEMLL